MRGACGDIPVYIVISAKKSQDRRDHQMKNYNYKTSGVCSSRITFDIDDEGCLRNVVYTGGCSGNLKGIGMLTEGMKASEAAEKLEGIRCGFKNSSCPDQLAKAIRSIDL